VLYLIDASVLITANNQYYAVDRVPEFWSWLRHVGEQGNAKMPLESFEEVKEGRKDAEKDLLFAWIQDPDTKITFLFEEEVNVTLVQRVINDGYAPDLTDDEVEQIGRDPFLIAYALAAPTDRCVVTTEVSKPSRKRQNRRIPDVCQTMGVLCTDPFTFCRALGFRTSWKP
jgi:hypothetical protein